MGRVAKLRVSSGRVSGRTSSNTLGSAGAKLRGRVRGLGVNKTEAASLG